MTFYDSGHIAWWHITFDILRITYDKLRMTYYVINVRSHDKFKKLYFHFHKNYDHYFWHVDDFKEGPQLPSHMTLGSHGHMRSCDNLKTLYLHFCKASGQTLQGCDFLWEALTHKATRLFDQMITWGHVTI